jgi:hypothetical protein
MKRKAVSQTTLALAVLLCSCGKDISKINDSINTASDTLRTVSDKLGKDLAVAADKIDPVALKRLLDENAGLRQQLTDLEKKAGEFGPEIGVIKLSGARLLLRVESYRGDFDLFAFTGSEAYWLLNPLTLSDSNAARLDANTQIPLDTGVAYKGYVDFAHLPNDCIHTASNSCGTVDYAVRLYAIPQIQKLIAAAVPRTGREFDLESQLPLGDNWLTLKVVPRALSPSSHDWFLRIQLLQVYSNGAEHILRSADWSSTIDAGAILGEPVKRQLVLPIRTVSG